MTVTEQVSSLAELKLDDCKATPGERERDLSFNTEAGCIKTKLKAHSLPVEMFCFLYCPTPFFLSVCVYFSRLACPPVLQGCVFIYMLPQLNKRSPLTPVSICSQLVNEQQESRPLLSPSIDDFLCETKSEAIAKPVTSNTAGNSSLTMLMRSALYLHMQIFFLQESCLSSGRVAICIDL